MAPWNAPKYPYIHRHEDVTRKTASVEFKLDIGRSVMGISISVRQVAATYVVLDVCGVHVLCRFDLCEVS